jgi:hypothetical protein
MNSKIRTASKKSSAIHLKGPADNGRRKNKITSRRVLARHLTELERSRLRRTSIRHADLVRILPVDLAKQTNLDFKRCEEIVGLARLQALSSVGPSIAADLWELGYHQVSSLAKAKPKQMYSALCQLTGHRVDPCVEDVFRCAVAQTRHQRLPNEANNWWYWTPFRGTDKVDP